MGLLTAISGVFGFASMAVFLNLTWRTSPRLSRQWFPRAYANLTPKQRCEWDARIASSLHAVFCILVWLVCRSLNPRSLYADPNGVGGTFWLLSIAFIASAGYMLADAISMLAYMSWREMSPYLLHHCLAMAGYVTCVEFGTLHYFVLFRTASELSTPFVNLLWFFRVSGFREEAPLVNLANSIVLLVVFAGCRILPIPAYWLGVFGFLAGRGVGFLRRHPLVGVCWLAYSLAFDALNVHWFRKLLFGGWKLLRNSLPPPPPPAETTSEAKPAPALPVSEEVRDKTE